MPSAMSIHFESDHPFIAVPLECETIEDLQDPNIQRRPKQKKVIGSGIYASKINMNATLQ